MLIVLELLGTGLSRSRIIDKVLVDFYIPFLPMAREHVISCARTEIEKIGAALDPEYVQIKYILIRTKLLIK
jgi:hypothetical protein